MELLNWERKLTIEAAMWDYITRYIILILLQRHLFLLQFSLVFLILRTQSFSNTYLVCSAGVQWPVKVGLWVGISVLVLGTSATITALVTRDKDSTAG